MSIDLRRFEYVLEPLRRQRQWQLDALLARMGKLLRAIRDAQSELDRLRATYFSQSHDLLAAQCRRLEPVGHVQSLRWLAQMKAKIHAGEDELRGLLAQRLELASQCLLQQYKVNVLETHREECVADFAREESGRLAAQADRDWLTRPSLHGRTLPGRRSRPASPATRSRLSGGRYE